MARTKQRAPLKREPSDLALHIQGEIDEKRSPRKNAAAQPGNGTANGSLKASSKVNAAPAHVQSGPLQLIICVGGIYASFLTWAYLQERITTTDYATPDSPPSAHHKWTYSIVLNTIQSALAALTGLLYLYFSTPSGKSAPSPIPSRRALGPLLLVAVTSSLASPFGYTALAHVDYVTFILAKACKLLPVMLIHITVFQRRHPLYKYLVVALVTAGVAVFTLQHPHKKGGKGGAAGGSSLWGLSLLGVNLLFDGLTNATQDHIFAAIRPYSGPQMMAAMNLLATGLTGAYLLFLPRLPPSLLSLLAIPISPDTTNELALAIAFLRAHPRTLADVLAFAACGAVGQVFIYATLARFSSLVLVTVTVTRKMLTMVVSVLAFGHRLGRGQWFGVGLVFGGVVGEAWMARRVKAQKEKEKAGTGGRGKKEL